MESILTEEARCAVLRALYEMAVNEETPASARIAAARLFLEQYNRAEKEQSALVIIDDETPAKPL